MWGPRAAPITAPSPSCPTIPSAWSQLPRRLLPSEPQIPRQRRPVLWDKHWNLLHESHRRLDPTPPHISLRLRLPPIDGLLVRRSEFPFARMDHHAEFPHDPCGGLAVQRGHLMRRDYVPVLARQGLPVRLVLIPSGEDHDGDGAVAGQGEE